MRRTEICSVAVWRSHHCRTRYSVSLCGPDGSEVECVGGDSDIEDAWEQGVDEARECGVPCTLEPIEGGQVTRRWEPADED